MRISGKSSFFYCISSFMKELVFRLECFHIKRITSGCMCSVDKTFITTNTRSGGHMDICAKNPFLGSFC